jgi:hypothetical protein
MGGRTVNASEHAKANKRLWVTIFVLLVLVCTFTLVVLVWYEPSAKHYEKLWDWSIAVVGTIFSILLGIALGLLHLNRQVAETQESQRERLCHLLIIELEESLEALGVNDSNERLTLRSIHPLVIEEAVKSGLFDRELTNNLLRLAKTYRKYNDHLSTLRAAREQESTTEVAGIGTDEVPQEAEKKTRAVLRTLKAKCSDVAHASS